MRLRWIEEDDADVSNIALGVALLARVCSANQTIAAKVFSRWNENFFFTKPNRFPEPISVA